MSAYGFNQQFQRGQVGEQALDRYFERWYVIAPVTMTLQRRGIDRLFIPKNGGFGRCVEYKTDEVAARTGNAFIETVSVDIDNKAGWAHTTNAEIIVYYLPQLRALYMIDVCKLRLELPKWEARYPKKTAQNKDYLTHGVLVPLSVLRTVCSKIGQI